MGMVKKSISVTDQQDSWVKAQIQSGNYGNESEVFRDLIRERVTRDAEVEAIRAALIVGEQSGISDRTPDQIMNAVIERKRKNGQL
ncbi:addiction module antidote protein, CC2985 family (plasmid) [Thalassoporum mexicanum PCC 7367]|uniref:type II toxin-antitoxin system ParD family antitoxin n=1 Tax=Thalassoporum mexicanum TaxID=3457544 RepID=UPI00029FBCE4|nr:type II toxin-antitoxin system ParD family antitoxin [Pseudanabaena sp. PCC 7367]AFY71981.1 addiction module antidote protein, CC2985 family [Pseudanabaena sp. PCC 7367]